MNSADLRAPSLAGLTLACLLCAPSGAASQGVKSLAWSAQSIEVGEGKGRRKADSDKAWLEVPRNWSKPDGPTFRLQILRFKATTKDAGDPIVYLAGGPGGSGTRSVTGDRFPMVDRLRAIADVIAIDQRGVLSEPFPLCRTPYSLPLDRAFDSVAFDPPLAEISRRCVADWLTQGVEVQDLDTRQSARDLEALREALGAPSLRIVSISYGTHLALATLRLHPKTISAVVLAGTEGPDHTLKSPKLLEAHLRRLSDAVKADRDASRLVPDLAQAFASVRESLKTPRTVRVKARDGQFDVTVGQSDLDLALPDMTSERGDIERLPKRVVELMAGQFESLASWALGFRRRSGVLPLSFVADCASGGSETRRAAIAREAVDSGRFSNINWPFPDICRAWPFRDAGDEFRAPLSSSVRALFLSGSLDGRTPRENAEEVLKGFPNGRHVVIEGGGHDDDLLIASPEIAETMVRFFGGSDKFEPTIKLAPLRFER